MTLTRGIIYVKSFFGTEEAVYELVQIHMRQE